ncbi:glycerol kinase GlpK [Maridesulfovibrio sp.]|uniref:glycerol kinase GlpK n=1 Tax=unclassified Maridesulfovibrio TaxID=2794999 RepID=UPI003B00974E
MEKKYIMVIDEGTTGTRALIFNRNSEIKAQAYTEFEQHHPAPDRVEHDAQEIWRSTRSMARKALEKAGLKASQIAAIGITNQRATTIVWDKRTGKPISRAIVWQDTRTADYVEEIRSEWADKTYGKTGWAMAPVYSSLMLHWMKNNIAGFNKRAEAGDLAFGTIDSWLIYKLTGGKTHAISASNASVTGAYDLHKDDWYSEWLDFLGLPLNMFPEVMPDSGDYGMTDESFLGVPIPITGAIADQHAALFAQGCIEPGTLKVTHGTGSFVDMNIGTKPEISKNGLNTIIAWRMNGETTYGLEGYSAVTGSAVQWLRDGAEMIPASPDTEELAKSVDDNGGVFFVPALAGLSAPYWDSYARGMIIGITRGTTRAHLIRATLEGIIYSMKDFIGAMQDDSGVEIRKMATDGGASANNFLMQFQADMLDAEVVRPSVTEATSLGAAYMAGLAVGYWPSPEACFDDQTVDRVFKPKMSSEERDSLYRSWGRAVKRAMNWAKDDEE